MKIDKSRVYVSTVAENARETALKHGLGLEIAEFCTATNMDTLESVPEHLSKTGLECGCFPKWDKIVREKLAGIDRCVFHAPFNELCPAAIEPIVYEAARRRYREAAALAQTYGAQRMVVHSGYVPLVYHKGYFHSRSVTFWRELLCELPDDFTLLLENVMEDSPEMLTAIVNELDDPRMQLTFDIGHSNCIITDVPVERWIEVCAPHIGHVHIHNNYREYDNHNPPEDGMIDMQGALNMLTELCPDATFTIESINAGITGDWLYEKGFI